MTKTVKKKKRSENEKTLFWVITVLVAVLAVIGGLYIYTQSQIKFNYKGIEFVAVNEGTNENPLILYQTNTLFPSNDGTNSPFGFRLRTKPSQLKQIDFENLEQFELMKVNGYSYGNNTFDCNGDGVIAMANLQRLFQKTGMQLVHDENETCDANGRYNFFTLKYGDKTEIKEVSPKCYEIVIEGNDDSCEILSATEKLMIEIFVKYGEM